MSLKVYYKFDESSGITATDSSGNGYNGTVINQGVSPNWTPGHKNNCLGFDGTDDTVNCGNICNFERTNTFSIAAWIFCNHINLNTRPIVTNRDTTAGVRGYGLATINAKVEMTLANDSSSNYLQVQTGDILTAEAWTFIVMTYSGNSLGNGIKIYKNSVSQGLSTVISSLSATIVSAGNLFIGNYSTYLRPFSGKLDEIRIFDTVLSQTEIDDLYNEPLLCWNYQARHKGSNRIWTANGGGKYPSTLKVPSSVDISTGIMMDEGKLISPEQFKIIH